MKYTGFAVALPLVLCVAASCGDSETPEAPAAQIATLVLDLPGDPPAASGGGVLVIKAVADGLPDLDAKFPIAENASLEAVQGIIRTLLPKVWSERVALRGNRIEFGSVQSASVDTDGTGIDARFEFAPTK